jgi:hypothetical protein
MDVLPYYVAVGVGAGFLVVLFLQNLRLALEYLLMLGKVAVVLTVLMLLGAVVGFWDMPQPMVIVGKGLAQIWRPFQSNLHEMIRGLLS